MARVRGNSRTAYNLKIKKQEEEKDAIKHGTRKVTNTSRTGKKEYKYWDSNKRKWVKKENFTKENKSFTKTNPKQTLSNEEIKKLQDKANEDRKFGKLSSRTDKGYQKPDTPPELKDTTTESSSNNGGSNNQSSNTNNKENKVEKKESNNNLKDAIKKNEKGLKELKNKKVNNSKKIVNEDKKKTTNKQKKNSDTLKTNKFRRTKGEGIEGKSKGYRGDTRITKSLKKSGFTESRLARLRKQHAEFKAKRKKK